jgi:hypothetical protein
MISVQFESDKLEIKLDVPILQIAKAIKTDIENNIEAGRSADGSGIAPLKQSTIRRKGNSRVFIDKGILRKSVNLNKINSNEYEITIGSPRTLIASYLQHGTNRMPSRKFFGVSSRIENLVESELNKAEIG